MLSMKQARMKCNLSLQEAADSLTSRTGNKRASTATLSEIERGVRVPDSVTRMKIESLLGPINWLDVPTNMLNTKPLRGASYEECERLFRRLVRLAHGLSDDELNTFLVTAGRHMRKLRKHLNMED